jgi:hypothetical protein
MLSDPGTGYCFPCNAGARGSLPLFVQSSSRPVAGLGVAVTRKRKSLGSDLPRTWLTASGSRPSLHYASMMGTVSSVLLLPDPLYHPG